MERQAITCLHPPFHQTRDAVPHFPSFERGGNFGNRWQQYYSDRYGSAIRSFRRLCDWL